MISSLCRSFSEACSVAATQATKSFLSVAVGNRSVAATISSYSSHNQHQQRHTLSSMASPKQSNDKDEEFVSVLKLNMLQDNPGAVKKKRRVGRGIGSSKGKTAGRGHKGQKARAGGSISLGFEGGQTKFYKLLPKRGFTNKRHKTDMLAINLGTIQDYIDMGRLTVPENEDGVDKPLTMKDLLGAGLCTASSVKNGIKLLAKGKERLTTPIHLEISRASEEAIQAVEAVGGEVTTVHYNRLALRALLKPHKFGVSETDDDGTAASRLPKFARPPPKWQPYYTNWERNRGYLSVQAQMRKLLKERPELAKSFQKGLAEAEQSRDDNSE